MMETFRNFLFQFSWSSMMGEITSKCAKALPQSVPFLSLSNYYLVMTILFSGQKNHVKSSTSSCITARKCLDTCFSCIHTDTVIHREDEYISLIFLGNLAKQIIAKRWSREVDLLTGIFLYEYICGFVTHNSTCFWETGHFQHS